jgi:hypothetical protein
MESARAVADAVLYEGFLLFPYGKSALKNQMPFQFGVVMPQDYPDPTEPPYLRSEFVSCASKDEQPEVEGALRFLHIAGEPIEREIPFTFSVARKRTTVPFTVDDLCGEIELAAESDEGTHRISLEVRNLTSCEGSSRNEALRKAFVSTHALLEIRGGVFASLLDPPQAAKATVSRCRNQRCFPVLTGDGGPGAQTAHALLVSPIILYDFPRIAEASRARTFDGTEIDELLMLSVASLTEEEKREARSAHPYVRELLERAEALDADTHHALHGELTGGAGKPGDETVIVDGMAIRRGSRVRVNPKRRADVWDGLVRGMTGRVNAVHTDFEGNRYVGVVFDADPASEMHEWYGRSFFYGADEVEPLR